MSIRIECNYIRGLAERHSTIHDLTEDDQRRRNAHSNEVSKNRINLTVSFLYKNQVSTKAGQRQLAQIRAYRLNALALLKARAPASNVELDRKNHRYP